MDEELEFHLDRVAEELADEGWPLEAARVEARRAARTDPQLALRGEM